MKTVRSSRGASLLISLSMLAIVAGISASLLSLALSTYRLSLRNEFRARAQAVAESELEHLFYSFKSLCLAGASADTVAAQLTDICDNSETPSTVRTAFLAAHRADGWRVRRSLITDRTTLQGNLPGTTKTGQFTYLNARIEVLPPAGSPYGNLNVRIGRRFINSTSTIFQYSIFYEGDLEITPGGNYRIEGDIAANGNVYLGVLAGKSLQIVNKLRYLGDHRFNRDSSNNVTYFNPDAPAPSVTLAGPQFLTSESSQVETMSAPENLLGGLDATATAEARPDLFGPASATDPTLWDATARAVASNNVYRSTIVPPPSQSTTNEYPNATTTTADDPSIEASRAYTRADIVVDVTSGGAITVTNKKTGQIITSALSTAITSNSPMRDQREGENVQITNIDVGALSTALASAAPNFNGLLYVNLKGASATSPAAVRLRNAEVLPNIGNRGFSVATNGGLYVQGNYNTKLSSTTAGKVSSMLMADALTVLSPGWDDANAAGALSTRVATGAVTLNAGLLTGNVASTPTRTSGGAQNLIRFLEDWTGVSVTFYGSIGRLFQSRHFNTAFPGPGTVYMPPSRTSVFDQDLAQAPPPGSPTTTSYSRGNFFVW